MPTTDYVPAAMRYRIRIEQPIQTLDPHTNEWIHTWGLLALVYADMNMYSGGESISSDKVTVQINVDFIIRYMATLTEKCRIIFETGIYQITAIVTHGVRHYQTITAILQK